MLKNGIGIGFMVLCLLGCAPASDATSPEPPKGVQGGGSASDDCKAKGGYMQQVGITGREACVIPFKDGGKVCTDGSQCEGDCWATPKAYGPDEKASGTCQPTNMPFGCHARVTEGRASPVLCVD